jgi:hypothetical protein
MEKFNVLDLMDKPKDQRFTEEEKEFLRKKYPRKESKIRYGIWKNEQRNGKQIVILTQFARIPGRKPGLDNSIEFISEEPLSEKEYEEYIENFGCTSRVYLMYRYENIEQVMREDAECGYETPEKFIRECRFRELSEQRNLFTETEFNASTKKSNAEDINPIQGD